MTPGVLLLLPLAIPMLAAGLTALAWTRPAVQGAITGIAVVAMLIASLLLLDAVSGGDIIAMQFGSWAPPFGITFVADRFGAIMVVVAAVMALAVTIFGIAELRRRHVLAGFHPLFHGLLAGINGIFLTGDIFNLYVWFEVTLITSMGLIVLGRTRAQLDGALKYAALNLFATLLFLIAVALLYGVAGTLNMADLAVVLADTEPSVALTVSAMLFFAGFGIKAGYFPLFFWLTSAYHTISVMIAALFAALISKAGIYASLRVFTLLFAAEGTGVREVAALMAGAGMLFGVFGAAVQWDIRRILAFHSVSQFGYIVLALALATPAAYGGAIFYIVHHSLVKANLFLIAGAVHRAGGSYDVRNLGGLMLSAPLLAAVFAVTALSLAGIPPLSGFWAKFMMVDATLRMEGMWWLAAIALFVGLLTLFSMTKIWMEAFWKAPKHKRVRKVPAAMMAPILMLALIVIAMGVFPEPFLRYALAAGESLTNSAPYIDAVLGGVR